MELESSRCGQEARRSPDTDQEAKGSRRARGPVPQWTGQGPRPGADHVLGTRHLEEKVHRGGDRMGAVRGGQSKEEPQPRGPQACLPTRAGVTARIPRGLALELGIYNLHLYYEHISRKNSVTMATSWCPGNISGIHRRIYTAVHRGFCTSGSHVYFSPVMKGTSGHICLSQSEFR